MSDDIVTRLREIECKDAFAAALIEKACREIERLRREVRETQMNACYAFARRLSVNQNAKALWYAKQMGWKCFEGGTE
jgi:hypothetical protein